MFKVGDKVKRVKYFEQDAKKGWPDFIENAVYTVTSEHEGMLKLENMGRPNTPFHPYDADCFELVKPEPQAAAIAGGLQEHDVGEYYPLAAVMYEHNGESIITIENLQTGEVAGMSTPNVYDTFEEAYKTIEFLAGQESWLRTKGRVVNINGRWLIADHPNSVRVTRLRNMLHRG